ncbi:MAG: metal ABC transporter permease [Phycisphaeraceae bacterium]
MSLNWTQLDTWIVVVGALAAVACALPGCFLVLRRMSLMGDAISHAVLPGLAVAFLFTGSLSSVPMFIGAAAAGLLTAFLTDTIRRFGHVEEGASLGVVFTTLFALGLILIRRAADHVHLDADCVLYGAIELTALDVITPWDIPRAAIVLGAVLLLNLAFVLVFYKELKISTFDPAIATAQGINATVMHYVLMGLVAVTVVAAFEAVGSILVIAMLIVPPAAAALLTDRLGLMIVIAVILAAVAAGGGHVSAIMVPAAFGFAETSTAGSMAVASGVIFFAALLAAPRHGLISRYVGRFATAVSVSRDDMLGLLWRLEESQTDTAHFNTISRDVLAVGPVLRRAAIWSLQRNGLLTRDGSAMHLTEAGREHATDVVRSHRLWEAYLHQHLKLRPDHLHLSAHRLEHVTDPAMRAKLAERTDRTPTDPHGQAIPPEKD